MRLIEVTPAPCIVCGAGNTPTTRGDTREFVDLERDVSWNEPVILCEDCALQVGGIIGMSSPDLLVADQQEIRALKHTIHALEAEIDSMKHRARRLGITFEPEPDEAEVAA